MDRQGGVSISIDRRHRIPMFYGMRTVFIRIAVYSKRKSTYKYPTTMKKYRFAALFPAYGEDEVIIDSVKSFLQQDYPRNYMILS